MYTLKLAEYSGHRAGWPHPGNNPGTPWISGRSFEILEKSLNFSENFERSLKSPRIFKIILEFRVWDDLPDAFLKSAPLCGIDSECIHAVLMLLKIMERSLNYHWILSWKFFGHPGLGWISGMLSNPHGVGENCVSCLWKTLGNIDKRSRSLMSCQLLKFTNLPN